MGRLALATGTACESMKFGRDRTRAKCRDRDSSRPQLNRERFREARDVCLACRVDGRVRQWDKAGYRTHIEDSGAAAERHGWQEQVSEVRQGGNIHVDDRPDFVPVARLERAAITQPGVVDEEIHFHVL